MPANPSPDPQRTTDVPPTPDSPSTVDATGACHPALGQARGEPADARADVFAPGGILTAVLTGKAVFAGDSAARTVRRAAAGDTADALARLHACGADAELVAVSPWPRPACKSSATPVRSMAGRWQRWSPRTGTVSNSDLAQKLAGADPQEAKLQRDLSVSDEKLGHATLSLGRTKPSAFTNGSWTSARSGPTRRTLCFNST